MQVEKVVDVPQSQIQEVVKRVPKVEVQEMVYHAAKNEAQTQQRVIEHPGGIYRSYVNRSTQLFGTTG